MLCCTRIWQAFRDMDTIWRRIMERVHANPLMSEVADTPGLLEELQKCNRSLDIVEKVRLGRMRAYLATAGSYTGMHAHAPCGARILCSARSTYCKRVCMGACVGHRALPFLPSLPPLGLLALSDCL